MARIATVAPTTPTVFDLLSLLLDPGVIFYRVYFLAIMNFLDASA